MNGLAKHGHAECMNSAALPGEWLKELTTAPY
jgi:hypothetical protein